MHHSIELYDIHVKLGDVCVLSGVSVEAKPYEFVSLVGGNGTGKTTLLKVANGMLRPFDTDISPENLIAQVRKVAIALKTEREAGSWEKSFLQTLKSLKGKLAPVAGKRAVVHWHARPFAAWAGLSVVQVIPMGELTPRVIADSIAQKPDVVLDILHSPVARTIAENAKCRYVQIINFPGVEKTTSLEDIFEYNTSQLLKAF